MKRKAAIELSVTAIVILILAIVMLGLGLGFIRGMFGKVSTQIEEQISIEAEPPTPTASNPITLSREKIITYPKEVNVLKIGAYNPTNYDWVSEAHSENLVGYWNFDNVDGNIVKDLSGNGNDGTVYWATPSPDGKYGNALSFDGDGDYIEVIDSPSLSPPADLTIGVWIYPVESTRQVVVNKRNSTAGCASWDFIVLNTEELRVNIYQTDSTSSISMDSVGTVNLNSWNHVLFVYDYISSGSSTVKIYINGIRDSNSWSNVVGPIQNTNTSVTVGYRSYVGYLDYFNGLIDEVMIFNKALTEEDVQELYETGVTPKVICDSSSMSGLMSSVNGRIVYQGESANFNYLMRLPGNVPEGEYLCKVVLMDYQKDFTIEVKK